MTSDQFPALGDPPGRNPGPKDGQTTAHALPSTEAETPRMDAAENTSTGDKPSAGDGPSPSPPAAPSGREAWRPSRVSALGAATAAGGLVLAVIGLASLFMSRDNGVSALDARLAGLELELRELAGRPPPADPRALDDVAGRLGKLEAVAATPGPSSDPAPGARIAALETEIKVLAQTVGMLGRRNDEAITAAREARARADANAAALAELSQKLARAQAPAVARGEIEALANRVAAVEHTEKASESQIAKSPAVESGDRVVRLALAATALKAAVDGGDPFTAELGTVQALAADPKLVAALEPFASTGVPTAAAFARELAAISPSLRQGVVPPPRESLLEKLQGHAEKLVRVRPLDAAADSEGAALAARIAVKVSRGDFAGARADLDKLPPDARAPAEAWIKKAQSRTAALDASRRLAADALAGLAK
jgi:hypothetical protein